MRRTTHGAFTLIELLVVVSIIVVLLALLSPALDRAVYQAQLAVCGSRQRAVVTGVFTYAADHGRAYPNRLYETASWGWTMQVAEVPSGYDLRPILKGYIEPEVLVDPLSPPFDLSPENTGPNDVVFCTYNFWFGYRYPNEKGMFRLGDAWSATPPGEAASQGFRLLIADMDLFGDDNRPRWFGAHPDDDGKASPIAYQGADGGPPGNYRITEPRWSLFGTIERGTVDANSATDDGAVVRAADVRWDEWERSASFTRVPLSFGLSSSASVVYSQVPAR